MANRAIRVRRHVLRRDRFFMGGWAVKSVSSIGSITATQVFDSNGGRLPLTLCSNNCLPPNLSSKSLVPKAGPREKGIIASFWFINFEAFFFFGVAQWEKGRWNLASPLWRTLQSPTSTTIDLTEDPEASGWACAALYVNYMHKLWRQETRRKENLNRRAGQLSSMGDRGGSRTLSIAKKHLMQVFQMCHFLSLRLPKNKKVSCYKFLSQHFQFAGRTVLAVPPVNLITAHCEPTTQAST